MKGFWMFSVALVFVLVFIILISRRTSSYHKWMTRHGDEEFIMYPKHTDQNSHTVREYTDNSHSHKKDRKAPQSQDVKFVGERNRNFNSNHDNGNSQNRDKMSSFIPVEKTIKEDADEAKPFDVDKHDGKVDNIQDKVSEQKPPKKVTQLENVNKAKDKEYNLERHLQRPKSPGIHIKKTIDEKYINHFMPKHADPKRFMIYFCHGGCGGLADRQKGIVGTYLMALLTNRTFGINITSPCEFTRFYRPNLLNWTIDPKDFEGLTVRYHSSLSGFEFLHKLHKTDLKKYYREDVVYFKGNIDYVTEIRRHPLMSKVIPYMTFLENPDVYSIILHILLGLAPKVSNQLASIFENEVKNKHLVCAHVRLGKNPTMADASRKLSMDEITELWPYLDKYKDPEQYRIFVAGDSNEVRAIANKRYGAQSIEVPGPIVHIARRNYTTKDVPVATLRSIQAQGMTKVVIEQNLLQRCDTLVLTRSGFNLMAVYQRNTSDNLFCLVKNQVLPCVRELVYNLFILF